VIYLETGRRYAVVEAAEQENWLSTNHEHWTRGEGRCVISWH
jgi:hypothetical protein